MSQHWHNLTKGALRIEKVSISVPGKFKKCLLHKNTVVLVEPFEDQKEQPVDIQVIPSGVLTSTQYGPCGTRGKSIQLPLSNLNETDDEDSSTNLLLRTWINSNYGVFLESLHPDIWHSNESTVSQNLQKNMPQGRLQKIKFLIIFLNRYILS